MMQPVLDALNARGGSARPSEVKEWIAANLVLDRGYLSATTKTGGSTFGGHVDWARFYLVRSGYIDSSKRGVWSVTELGRTAKIDDAKVAEIVRNVSKDVGEVAEAGPVGTESAPKSGYVDQTLALLKGLPAGGFENLCQRVLRESGFEEVTVTGRSGDGGIDGQGILKLNAFVSFRVLFQCKRYKDSVGPGVVRDFRGAMAGRAEKGIIITTGYFTPAAENEASRDGAQPVELVDGDALVRLLADLELGLKRIDSYELDSSFFRLYEQSGD